MPDDLLGRLFDRLLLAGYERPPAEESALEVGLLERRRVGRKFYRMPQAEVVRELAAANPKQPPALPQGASPAQLAGWTVVARVLLNLDETITRE